MIELVHMNEIEKASKLPIEVQDVVANILDILDTEYGEDRSKTDLGGYVAIIENKDDLIKLNEILLNFNSILVEYVDKIHCSNNKTYLNAFILLSSDYSISLIVNKIDAPENLINQI